MATAESVSGRVPRGSSSASNTSRPVSGATSPSPRATPSGATRWATSPGHPTRIPRKKSQSKTSVSSTAWKSRDTPPTWTITTWPPRRPLRTPRATGAPSTSAVGCPPMPGRARLSKNLWKGISGWGLAASGLARGRAIRTGRKKSSNVSSPVSVTPTMSCTPQAGRALSSCQDLRERWPCQTVRLEHLGANP